MAVYVLRLVALTFTHPPKEHAKRVHVNGFVILLFDHFRCHVDGRSHQRVAGKAFGFAETQVSQLSPVVLVQLREQKNVFYYLVIARLCLSI